MNVYLIGYMGSGKSTIGKQLARLLDFSLLDIDNYFEETYKIGIMKFFEKYDENAFRHIEHSLLLKTFELDNYVVSTGGGTPCFFDNMKQINDNGISVYIAMHPNSLFVRLKNAKRPRPRTSFLDDQSLKDRIAGDMLEREPFYRQAKIHIKGESIDVPQLAELIRAELELIS